MSNVIRAINIVMLVITFVAGPISIIIFKKSLPLPIWQLFIIWLSAVIILALFIIQYDYLEERQDEEEKSSQSQS